MADSTRKDIVRSLRLYGNGSRFCVDLDGVRDKTRVALDGASHPLESIRGVGEVLVSLVRRRPAGDKADGRERQRVGHFGRGPQVADVDRVEGAAIDADAGRGRA